MTQPVNLKKHHLLPLSDTYLQENYLSTWSLNLIYLYCTTACLSKKLRVTLSKALDNSKTDISLSTTSMISLHVVTNWVVQKNPFWYSCCSWHKNSSRIVLMLLRIICSNSLQDIHVRDTGLYFPGLSLLPFLKTAPTLTNFQISGKTRLQRILKSVC